MKNNFFAIIPARAGSKGIPNKNMKDLNGIPLIQYTINAVLASQIEEFIISTDSKEIIKYCIERGYNYLVRPEEFSQDDSKAIDVINHVIESKKINHEYIIYLQPTSPLRTEYHINESIELIDRTPEADSLVSIVNVPHNFVPESLMKIKDDFLYEISDTKVYNRQKKPDYYARNGAAIYITKRKNLKHFIFGGNILGYKMGKIESLDIDDDSDLNLARIILKNKNDIK